MSYLSLTFRQVTRVDKSLEKGQESGVTGQRLSEEASCGQALLASLSRVGSGRLGRAVGWVGSGEDARCDHALLQFKLHLLIPTWAVLQIHILEAQGRC